MRFCLYFARIFTAHLSTIQKVTVVPNWGIKLLLESFIMIYAYAIHLPHSVGHNRKAELCSLRFWRRDNNFPALNQGPV
jgi:hypothetical protein